MKLFSVFRESVIRPVVGEAFTPGKMYLDGVFFCNTCEDEDRQIETTGIKVPGKTAIPRGRYKLEVTMSKRFGKLLPQVLLVPHFEGIRLHGGNKAEDSEGCILCGSVRTATGIAQCSNTIASIIRVISAAKSAGEDVYLEVG